MLGKRVLGLVAGLFLLGTCAFAATAPKHYAADVNGQKITDDAMMKVIYSWYSPRGVDEYITMMLVDEEAKKAGVVITDQQIHDKLMEMQSRMKLKPGTTLDDQVKQNGYTLTYARAMIKANLQADAILRQKTKVTPTDLEGYRRASHILISIPPTLGAPDPKGEADAKAKAEKVLAEIKGGKSFEAAAKEYSDDTGTKDRDGDIGWFAKGPNIPEFDKAVFEGKVGDIVGGIRTIYGYHIIKITGIGKDATGEDLKTLNEMIIKSQINIPEWMAKIRSEAKVESDLVPKPQPAAPAK